MCRCCGPWWEARPFSSAQPPAPLAVDFFVHRKLTLRERSGLFVSRARGYLDEALIRPGRYFSRVHVRNLTGAEAQALAEEIASGDEETLAARHDETIWILLLALANYEQALGSGSCAAFIACVNPG